MDIQQFQVHCTTQWSHASQFSSSGRLQHYMPSVWPHCRILIGLIYVGGSVHQRHPSPITDACQVMAVDWPVKRPSRPDVWHWRADLTDSALHRLIGRSVGSAQSAIITRTTDRRVIWQNDNMKFYHETVEPCCVQSCKKFPPHLKDTAPHTGTCTPQCHTVEVDAAAYLLAGNLVKIS